MRALHLHLIAGVAVLSVASSNAQVGNDNPTGTSGAFNAQVTTGCAYDPYTGNASRAITDISVAGAVGVYPLAFTRTLTTRYAPAVAAEFGEAGSWRHAYQWSVDSMSFSNSHNTFTAPTSYTVSFPDGRRIVFSRQQADSYFHGPPGTRERFVGATTNGSICKLILPDGGQVQFQVAVDYQPAEQNVGPSTTNYDFTLVAIVDPYGQTTTITQPDYSTIQITEPAGRWIQVVYASGPIGDNVIDHLQSSDGRTVQYSYAPYYTPNATYSALVNVRYFNDPSLDASYSYQNDNLDVDGRPLISTATDPMYRGPMWRIGYTFAAAGTGVVSGQLQSENYVDGSQAVSTLFVDPNVPNTRTEVRGDGPERTFTYAGAQLSTWTDFQGHQASQQYDAAGFLSSAWDFRNNRTDYPANNVLGFPTQILFPQTPSDTPPGTSRGSVSYNYGGSGCSDPNNQDTNDPFYLCVATDESGNSTRYTRDASNRVTRIDYPDSSYETFAYNNFGQITTHRLRSGGSARYEYDASGTLTAYRDPYHLSGNPTARYQYDGLGRISGVTDARGGYTGDPNYTTTFQYNTRSQVTTITQPGGSAFRNNAYNANGTLAAVTDELSQTTTFVYDDYKRLRGTTDPLTHTTRTSYSSSGDFDDYSHADSNVLWSSLPSGKVITTSYDGNWRKKSTTVGSGSETATTAYDYDANGNLLRVAEPLQQYGQAHYGQFTSFAYDERNRKQRTTDALGNYVTWTYDASGRRMKETRSADNASRLWNYDSMNRVSDTYGFANEHTGYHYDAAGNVDHLTDAKGAVYYFSYDYLSRKSGATYPTDATQQARNESWLYDTAGNMYQYTNPAGQAKTLTYDNRNRLVSSTWNTGGPNLSLGYNDANRLTSIVSNGGETSLAFRYDAANHKIEEDQSVVGMPTRTLTSYPDIDGNDQSIGINGVGNYAYTYNSRNQLGQVQYGGLGGSTWYQFSYDLNGNLLKRQNTLQGGDSTNLSYDALNRVAVIEQSGLNDGVFARSHYGYDNLHRLTSTNRDEDGSGESYGYDGMGQLTSATYNEVSGYRAVSYNVDPLNRISVDDNGTAFYSGTDMNQYTSVTGQSLGYDANFNLNNLNGGSVSYDNENRPTSISVSGSVAAQFVYDGLGRCLKRTMNGATSQIAYYGWKPFGEWDGAGTLLAYNIYGAGPDEILLRWQGGVGNLHYHLDRLGNVQFLLGDNGTGLERYTYDAFGDPTVTNWDRSGARNSSNYGNRFMFTGREYFPSLSLYDYRTRFYRPSLGRFLQPDPLGFGGGDPNLFRYCGGDPVNFVDPIGLSKEDPPKKQKQGPEPPVSYGPNAADPGGPDRPSNANYIYDPNNVGTGFGERVTVGGPPEPMTGWGPADSISSGRGGSGLRGDGGGPSGSGEGGTRATQTGGSGRTPRFSGAYTVEWWPQALGLPYSSPPTAQQIAWTNSGRTPTLLAAAVIFGPLALPEAAAPVMTNAAYSSANGILANPQIIAWGGLAFQQFISPSGPQVTGATGAELYGYLANSIINEWFYPLGP